MDNFYTLQIRYYSLGDFILLCDMPGFENNQQSIRLEHVLQILDGQVQNRADVNI